MLRKFAALPLYLYYICNQCHKLFNAQPGSLPELCPHCHSNLKSVGYRLENDKI